MEMAKDTMRAFRKDFEEAMKPLERKYNISIELGTITYYEENFKASFTATNGVSKGDVERNKFDANVWKYKHLGLDKGMYNRLFIGGNARIYALQGFQTNARKYPLIILDVETGERGKAGERFIIRLLDDYYTDVTVSAEDHDPLLLEGTAIDIEDLD